MNLTWDIELCVNESLVPFFQEKFPMLKIDVQTSTIEAPNCVVLVGNISDIVELLEQVKENVMDVSWFSFDFAHSFI